MEDIIILLNNSIIYIEIKQKSFIIIVLALKNLLRTLYKYEHYLLKIFSLKNKQKKKREILKSIYSILAYHSINL